MPVLSVYRRIFTETTTTRLFLLDQKLYKKVCCLPPIKLIYRSKLKKIEIQYSTAVSGSCCQFAWLMRQVRVTFQFSRDLCSVDLRELSSVDWAMWENGRLSKSHQFTEFSINSPFQWHFQVIRAIVRSYHATPSTSNPIFAANYWAFVAFNLNFWIWSESEFQMEEIEMNLNAAELLHSFHGFSARNREIFQ